MKLNQKSLINEAARLSELKLASERLAEEVDKFIDFIEAQNPDIDTTTAVLTAVICIEQLPALFTDNPDMMRRLKAIATELSKP